MSRQKLLRVYELIDLIQNRSEPSCYFQSFDDSIREEPSKAKVWITREQVFQRLDLESWDFLKSEALPFLTCQHASRGWEQLISILNQAWAYNYLIDEGCQTVRFIPRASRNGIKTPDLFGTLNGKRIVCEVKTINISEIEANRRKKGGVGLVENSLTSGFFNKLNNDLLVAKEQMESYDNSFDARRIAFVVLNFDDFLAEYKDNYFAQIDKLLGVKPVHGFDVVFFNQRTAFHGKVEMQNATVINEPG